MTETTLTRDEIFEILDEVKDPEVPVLSVVELGIIRDVQIDAGAVTITITPTYSGCPAMRVIEEDITTALAARGVEPVRLQTSNFGGRPRTLSLLSVARHADRERFRVDGLQGNRVLQ